MLMQLTVKNLAIVAELELNFSNGMHVITGETGAGKSIIIDALSLVLGERASAEQIRANQTQAEVTASFDIRGLPAVQAILETQELSSEECIIRRIISNDGRSRAYINGQSVSASQIKAIAPFLVHIHSQHQHHALLESDYQRQLLDVYADHPMLLANVQYIYEEWLNTKHAILELTEIQQQADRLTLLNYQIQELETLNLQPNEMQTLEQKHTQLAKSEELIATCQNVCTLLADSSQGDANSILDQLHTAYNQIVSIQKFAPAVVTSADLIKQAIIQVEEANSELHSYFDKLDLDPEQLVTIEQRLSTIHALARKLKVSPEFLTDHLHELRKQRDNLTSSTEKLDQLQQKLRGLEADYQVAAQKLSASRNIAANKLSKLIVDRIKHLEMPNAKFDIQAETLKHGNPAPYGNEAIHFMVTTNPGQPLGFLKKIASGGELSRISLAIQVITAEQMATPTLILDEVDVGISGKTAATVGSLMRELGANAQIICITHLPQVAAQGHHHFKVEKIQTNQDTTTKIIPLNRDERVQELARLLGGVHITPEAIANAEQLIDTVCV